MMVFGKGTQEVIVAGLGCSFPSFRSSLMIITGSERLRGTYLDERLFIEGSQPE